MGKLAIIVSGEFFNSGSVTVVIVLKFVSQARVIIDEPGYFGLTFLPSSL